MAKAIRDDLLHEEATLQADIVQEEDSLAEQYRGTPPLKSKMKKKHDRRSHEISDQVGGRRADRYNI